MKMKMGHHEREARIMAGMLIFIVVFGTIAGIVVQRLHH